MKSNTYWTHKGKFETESKALEKLIPGSGSVDSPRKNRALEKFRKASNCYYDLYNNLLINRGTEFYQVFKIASSNYLIRNPFKRIFDEKLFDVVEDAMDEIVQKAYIEQFGSK